MKARDKYIIMIIIFIVVIISFLFAYKVFSILKEISPKSHNIAYVIDVKDNVSYNVYVKENPYIEESLLTSDSSYVTSLIDKIEIIFDYEYNVDRDINIEYSYQIMGTIVSTSLGEGNERLNNPIWTKDYVLLKESSELNNNKNIKVSEKILVSLDSYNDLVDNFINDYNILINSSLDIKLIIRINSIVGEKNINNEHHLIASIPLGVKAFDITTSKNFAESENIYLTPPIQKEEGFMKVIVYIVINIIMIGVTYYVVKKIITKYNSGYIVERNRILKDYDDKIVQVSNFVKYESWEIIDVSSFEELLNLSNEAFEPIFYWEKKVHRNRETWFSILRDKILYRYVIYKNDYNGE